MPCRAIVDPVLCIGSSQCTEVAPNAFAMNDDHTQSVPLHGATDEDLINGAMSCPVQAITIVDEHGKQVYPK